MDKFNRLKRIMGTTRTREKTLEFIKSENQFLMESIRDVKIGILQAKRRANLEFESTLTEEDRLREEIEIFLSEIDQRERKINQLRDQYAKITLDHEEMMRKKRKRRRENTFYCTFSDH